MAKTATQKRRREAEADQERHELQKLGDAKETGPSEPPSKKARVGESRSLFVRSLPPSATSESLTEFFSEHFPVKHAVVVVDGKTKVSRGYGFVTFADADDAVEAKAKLNNVLLDGRRLRLDIAEPRNRPSAKDGPGGHSTIAAKVVEEKKKREEALTEARKAPKLIVRNLPWSVKTSEDLTALFRMYGKVKFADLPSSKGKLAGFGFVTLRGRKNAEKAIEAVNGKVVDGRTLAVDWAVDKQTWEEQQKQQEEAEAKDGADGEEKPKKKRKAGKEKGDEAPEAKDKDEEDEPMDQEDADIQNFMKNHMENLEDESDKGSDAEDDEEDEEWEDEDEDDEEKSAEDTEAVEAAEEEPKKKPTTDNSTTIFVRNLPFTATEEDIKTHFAQFGAIRYARVVMDRATDRPAGTGFVCFFNVEDFKNCVKGAPRHKPTSATGKHSVLQDETVDRDGRYTMDGRILQVTQAVSKEQATQLSADGPDARWKQEKDKRRLYLLNEGSIARNSPLYSLLPPSEVKMREASAMQRKKLVEGNPSLFLSLTRLAIRNIPRDIDSKALKALAREAIVGFAKDVKEGRRLPLSKEELARGGQEDKDAEHRRKEKGKGVVKQAKIVFESKEGSKIDEKGGGGKSRGYGFIEYWSHRWALMGLRWLNGHALKNEAGKTSRLIAEFAIENRNVVLRRRENEDRARKHELAHRAEGRPSRDGRPGRDGAKRGGESAGRWEKQKRAKFGKPAGGEEEKAGEAAGSAATSKEGKDKKAKAEAKLAQRQQIIGRKRMMRKKKAQTRGKK